MTHNMSNAWICYIPPKNSDLSGLSMCISKQINWIISKVQRQIKKNWCLSLRKYSSSPDQRNWRWASFLIEIFFLDRCGKLTLFPRARILFITVILYHVTKLRGEIELMSKLQYYAKICIKYRKHGSSSFSHKFNCVCLQFRGPISKSPKSCQMAAHNLKIHISIFFSLFNMKNA